MSGGFRYGVSVRDIPRRRIGGAAYVKIVGDRAGCDISRHDKDVGESICSVTAADSASTGLQGVGQARPIIHVMSRSFPEE